MRVAKIVRVVGDRMVFNTFRRINWRVYGALWGGTRLWSWCERSGIVPVTATMLQPGTSSSIPLPFDDSSVSIPLRLAFLPCARTRMFEDDGHHDLNSGWNRTVRTSRNEYIYISVSSFHCCWMRNVWKIFKNLDEFGSRRIFYEFLISLKSLNSWCFEIEEKEKWFILMKKKKEEKKDLSLIVLLYFNKFT